jgi:thiamine kinase-like enzyme
MTDPKLYTKLMKNKEMQDLKHMINYDWLLERIDQFPKVLGEARDVFVKVKEQAMEELKANPKALVPIHGDLWPGK